MKSSVKINAIAKTITVSKSFFKKASSYGSAEYEALRSAMNDNPGFKIVFKTTERNDHNGLTFRVMEEYIMSQPNAEVNLKKFEAVKRIAKAKNGLYPLTKNWFLKTFSDYLEKEISECEMGSLKPTA